MNFTNSPKLRSTIESTVFVLDDERRGGGVSPPSAAEIRPMVFVLDDEPALRDSLRCLLETENYRVETFESPTAFLQLAETGPNTCLILDLKMPEMHGLDVLQAVMSRTPKIPTIVLTALSDVPSVVTAMRLGAVNLLEKPCSDEQLLSAVHEALNGANGRQTQSSSSQELRTKIDRLSQREREILEELVSGKNIKEIALRLGTSPNTVRNQKGSILEKMGATSPADLVRIVLQGRKAI